MRRSLVAAALVLVVACSGGDGLTRAQFIRKGDAICQGLLTDGAITGPASSAADLVAAVDRFVPAAERARRAFARLAPPDDGRGPAVKQAILDFLDSAISNGKRARTALDRGDLDAAGPSIAATVQPSLQAQELAKSYGFDACAGASLQL